MQAKNLGVILGSSLCSHIPQLINHKSPVSFILTISLKSFKYVCHTHSPSCHDSLPTLKKYSSNYLSSEDILKRTLDPAISHILIYFVFISILLYGFSSFFEILFLIYGLFINVSFNFQMFGDFLVVILLLVSSLV